MPRPYWKPERKEIDVWFEQQVQEFAVKENRSKRLTTEEWKNKYIFMEIYEIFFVTIAIELQEWLARLVDFQKCWKDKQVTQWTPERILQLEETDNTITHTVDHWVVSVIGGFVIEFTVDQFVSYSEAEWRFFMGFYGKFLKTLSLLIKILLCDKSILCSHTE